MSETPSADWWQREASGRPPASADLRELVDRRAAEGGEWIVAWAILQLAEAVDRKGAT